MKEILQDLNEKQKEAVMHKDGPLLVIAGPGTGKTRVITHRISYLIRTYNVNPENILAIAFTKKAAQEMQERVNREIGEIQSSKVKIFNFHSFCYRTLREHASAIELDEDFRILDQETQEDLLIRIVKELNFKLSDYKPKRMLTFISNLKLNLQEITDNTEFYENGLPIIDKHEINNIKNIIDLYQNKLDSQNALDYDDLLFKTVELYEKNPEIKTKSHNELTHILVDEYHDVNLVQYRLLQLLCPATDRNLMIVSDKDQSIYSWRGSSTKYIDLFQEDFSPRIILLDQHYRCTGTILNAAKEVISHNSDPNRPSLNTDNSSGEKIVHCSFQSNNEFEEATSILKLIENMKEKHLNDSDTEAKRFSIAILYRNHKFADVLREQLALRSDTPFRQWIQSTNPLQERLRQAVVSYLSLVNSNSNYDIEQAINFPEMRLDELTLVQLKKLAYQQQTGLSEILRNIKEYLPKVGPLIYENINQFWEDIQKFHSDVKVNNEKISRVIIKLLDVLEHNRSPFHSEDLKIIKNLCKLPNITDVIEVLHSAVVNGDRIHITAKYGIDEYCAAHIIYQTFESYFDQTVQIQFLLPNTDEPQISAKGVHILIGDFGELELDTTQANIILIGSTDCSGDDILPLVYPYISISSEETSTIHSVHSITALKLCQHFVGNLKEHNLEDIVVYDLETTGVNPNTANIVQIAACRLNTSENQKPNKYEEKVKPPGGQIPEASTEIHGISTDDVINSRSIEDVLPEFCEFIQDSVLVGHNIAQYDNRILNRDMQEYINKGLTNLYYDTLVVARRLFPQARRSLKELADKFNIEFDELEAHKADKDVEVNLEIFKKLIEADVEMSEVKSLTKFLPLVGFGILAKLQALDHIDTINGSNDSTDKEGILEDVLAYLNPAKRYIKNIINKKQTSLLMQQVDTLLLEPEETTEIKKYIDNIRKSNIPNSPEDIEWKEERADLIKSVRRFEEISDDNRLSVFLNYQKRINDAVRRFEIINNDRDNANRSMMSDETQEKLTLMSLHTAKGTEFDVVIIIGMEEGSFPQIWQWSNERIEEERRLFYVGMTRAKKRLYLSTSMFRFLNNQDDSLLYLQENSENYMDQKISESMFISEIPSDLIQKWSSK